jgi:hypothetical protein
VWRSKHVEQLKNIEIINSTTRSHLVDYFYNIYGLHDDDDDDDEEMLYLGELLSTAP